MTKKNNKYLQHAENYLWWLGAVDRHALQIFAPYHSKHQENLSWLLSRVCYKVVRCLPVKKESERFKKVFDTIGSVEDVPDKRQAIDAVEHVRKELREFYGKDSPVLASKLLWFKFQSPIIICDYFTAKALHLNPDWKKTSYEIFYDTWRKEFKKEKQEILEACHIFKKENPERARTVSKRWFRERVFDFYLMEKGGQTKKTPKKCSPCN